MSHLAEETYAVYNENDTTARKEHTCDACKETISPGHRYIKVCFVHDHRGETVKRCLRCQKVHLHLRELGRPHDMWPAEKLNCGEDYKDEWGKEPPPEIAALAFALPHELQEVT